MFRLARTDVRHVQVNRHEQKATINFFHHRISEAVFVRVINILSNSDTLTKNKCSEIQQRENQTFA